MVCKSCVVALVAAISYCNNFAIIAAENDPEPILRIETGGHSSFVTSAAWAPNGRDLWTAGWDKVVRVWRVNADGKLVGKPDETIRLPIGPGPNGKIDTLAFSKNGRWVAIGGYSSLVNRAASFRDQGIDTPISSVELREQGVIYVLDRGQNSFRRLEGHLGPVRRLAFVSLEDGSEQLVSAGYDRNAQQVTTGSIRTWDVVSGKQMDGILLPELLPEPPMHRPSLAAFNLAGTEVQVLATSGSGKMFHWQSSQPRLFRTNADGLFNNLALPQSRPAWIVSASADDANRSGRVSFWNLDKSGLPQRDAKRQIAFPEQPGGERYLPLAVCSLSSRPGEAKDLIAVVLCVLDANFVKQRIQLRLLAVPDQGGQAREYARKDLWKSIDGDPVPDLAANENGEFLAVVGHPDHQVLVFNTAELLSGKAEAQRLAGQSATPQEIEFVDREGELGLRVLERTMEAAPPTKYIFNFAKNQVELQDAVSWQTNRPVTSNWTVVRAAQDSLKLNILQAGVIRKTVQVPALHTITTFALSAPVTQTGIPLLAVAAHENGQPWLGVFDLRDGLLKRVYQAHTEPIVSLSLSADSRLLASASKDQTIAVWDMSDQDQLLSPRSILAGVALLQKGKVAQVERVEPTATAASIFREGDQIAGFFDAANPNLFQPWESLAEQSATLGILQAGTQLKIRRRRGTQSADVMVTLQQAVDVPKPLFQLLITKPNAQGIRQWIGWSPLGPFDASDRQMRQRLGWHLNVARPGIPVAFVPLDEYPEFHSSGLMRDLIANLGKPVVEVPLALIEPRMSLKVLKTRTDIWNQVDSRNLLRTPPQVAQLQITNSDFPVSSIKNLTLVIDGQSKGTFAPTAFNSWQVEGIDNNAWPRGTHRLQAELVTNEIPARNFVVESHVDYVPLSPKLAITTVPVRSTKAAGVPLAAIISPAATGVAFETSLLRIENDGARTAIQTWKAEPNQEQVVDVTLELREGYNQFVLQATNAGANLAGTSTLETVSQLIEVERIARDKNPPMLSIAKVESIEGSNTKLLAYTPNASTPLVVESEEFSVTGNIVAGENLVSATADGKQLPGFVPNSTEELNFVFPVKLKPGSNSIRFAAKTDVSPEAELKLDVLFRQPIPDIEILQPVGNQQFSILQPQATFEFRAVFQVATNLRPLTATAIVNGQPLAQAAKIDLQAGTISGIVPLVLGANNFELELTNDTGATASSRLLTTYYQPSPIISGREMPQEIEGAVYPVELSGESATSIERVLVDGRELPQEQWVSNQIATQFKLRIAALPWQGDRRQSVLLIFAQGADKPAIQTIDIPKRRSPARPPTLVFLSPGDNSSTASEETVIEYLVQSQEPLTKVALLHDGHVADDAKLPPGKAGIMTNIQRQVKVVLRAGLNHFQLYAENKDGLRSHHLTLNYVPSPVVLELDALVPADKTSEEHLLVRLADGSWGVDRPTGVSRHTLKGRVRWNYRNEVALQNARLQVWVAINGFKQAIRVQPPAPNSFERAFTCPIQLFRDQNVIEVTAPGLPELANVRATAKIACQSPEIARQRLHLLIVGIGVAKADESSLIKEAVLSLSGSQIEELEDRNEFKFKSPAFAECSGYALTGASMNREKIETALELIRLSILREPVNDVTLMYYRGGEQVYNDGQFYLTAQTTKSETDLQILRNPLQLKNFAIDSSGLSKYVSTYPGTQLLLLDVARTTTSGKEVPNAAPDIIPGAATFRYAWLKRESIPDDARLISAWQSTRSARLDLIERSLASQHIELSQRYQNAVSYENYMPEVLRDLVIGKTD